MQFRKKIKEKKVRPEIERLGVSKEEAAKMLGLSERTIHELTLSGELRCKRVGRRVIYSVEILREFLRKE